MRFFSALFILAAVSLVACKKSGNDNSTDGPSGSFSLDYMEIEENLFGAHLYLYGNFGDSTPSGQVKIGNTLIGTEPHPDGEGVILEWKRTYIKVSIGGPNDNAGAGYVSVIRGNDQTNKRMLNVWEVSLYYREPDEGSILKEVRFNALLRADADPHGNGFRFKPNSSFCAESQALWAIGGQGHASYSDGGMTISLEDRSGIVIWSQPYRDNTGEEHNFQSELKFENRTFILTNLRMHKNKATLYSFQADGAPTPYVVEYDFLVQVIPANGSVKLELDNSKSIKAGTFTTGPHGTQYDFVWDGAEALNHMHTYTLEWEKAEPRFKM